MHRVVISVNTFCWLPGVNRAGSQSVHIGVRLGTSMSSPCVVSPTSIQSSRRMILRAYHLRDCNTDINELVCTIKSRLRGYIELLNTDVITGG